MSTTRPVLIRRSDCHSAVANSKALELADLTDASPDPEGGALGRDAEGRLDGRLIETPAVRLVERAAGGTVTEEDLIARALSAGNHYLERGILNVTDMMTVRRPYDPLKIWREACRRGLPLDVDLYLTWLGGEDPYGMPDLTESETTGAVRYAGVKLFADGSISGRTAAMREPFRLTDDEAAAGVGPKNGEILLTEPTIEDGGVMGGEMQKLYRAYEDGVRLVTLTWNHENEIGYPNSTDRDIMQKGLKPFGFEVLEEMNRLGMVIDVSHLSDGGFLNVAEFAKKTGMPFVASHSNARAITAHPRNLPDMYIRKLSEAGGVMGLNFASHFLSDTQPPDGESRICDMVTHILHIRKIAGSEVLAIGSDFDGVESRMEIDSPAKMVMLYETLHQTGLSEDELEKIFYKNAQRVLTAVLR